MKTPWTPGPWKAVELENGNIVTGDTRHCGNVCELDRGTESEANAALIAAAPDLAEALAKLLDAFGDYAEWHGPSADPSHHRDDCPDDDCPGCALDDATQAAVESARAALRKAGAL